MLLEYRREHRYNLIEESKIETECGGLYQAQDLEMQRTVAVKCVEIEGNNQREKLMLVQKAMSEVRALINLCEEDLSIPIIYEHFMMRIRVSFISLWNGLREKHLRIG